MRLNALGLSFLYTFYSHIFTFTIISFVFILTLLTFLKFKNFFYFFTVQTLEFFKKAILVLFILNFFLVLAKFIVQLFFVQRWLSYVIYNTDNKLVMFAYLQYFQYGVYTNNVGYGLLFLCYITTILTVYYLGDRDLLSKGFTLFYFNFFLLCTTVMVDSTNLLVIFISFELIFLPSIYFVYNLGYVKKVDKTIYFLLVWTLCGSFLLLFGFSYLYSIYGTLDYKILLSKNFTPLEHHWLYFIFFLGFSVKIPLFPFHYWLTKVHVEAPAGFSMFLSGFLVKTALYCFYYVNLLFTNTTLKYYFVIWICICILEASVKMWVQVDIKKLIAFATIQEMNMLLLGVLLLQTITNNIIVLFIIMHGILSTYMFFLVDQIQKRAQTRNIILLSGFGSKYPLFRFYVWIMLILYLGFPFTIKFAIEWHIGALLVVNLNFFGMLIFFFALFFGAVGFVKCWLLILYGQPHYNLDSCNFVDMLTKDRFFSWVLIFLLFSLNFFIFFL